MITLSRHTRVVPHDDGAVVFDHKKGVYYQVNAIGAHILTELGRGVAPATIATDLEAAVHDAPADRINADVDEFIATMRRLGLLS